MDIVNLVITILGGLAGGNAAGAASKNNGLGALANSLLGVVGGGGTNWLLQTLGVLATHATTAAAAPGVATTGDAGFDIASIVAHFAGSGVGGAVLVAIINAVKSSMNK